MKFTLAAIIIVLILHFGICKESVFRELFRRGKSALGRSYDLRHFDDPTRDSILYPEHREEIREEEELEEHSVPKHAYSNHQHYPQKVRKPEYTDNRKDAHKIAYHTDIIENDNMDLYGIIGGISFASLLATTLYILSRREGSVLRSLDEMFGSDMPAYRKLDRFSSRGEWTNGNPFLLKRRG
ncbi:unnamed protein product [Orchesella dallaii]|uniref:Uncharacterized protein n=1 Tax=Orchesella dallaii TaxID=48710 RepID=A0ABP1S301_9HEXA